MPRYDKTGPSGQGPLTGRGLGSCRGGRGLGRGVCRWFGFAGRKLTKTEESTEAQEYVKDLKAELKESEEYLKELKGKK